MSVVTATGTAQPFEPESYPVFGTRTPGLRSFRLTHLTSDHEVAIIQVLAGGIAEDITVSSEPGLGPANIPDGRLDILFQDASPSDDEFGYLVSHSTLNMPRGRRYQIRDVGCVGECTRKLPATILGDSIFSPAIGGSLVALVGFKLFFTGARDHQMDRIGVWFDDNDLHVAFRDRDGGDVFGYLVDFVVIPTVGLNVTSGVERGTGARAFETRRLPSPSRSHFFLTGWAFNFQGRDHELLDIGVIRREEDFTVFFGDSGGGDPFDWRVEWAHLSPVLVAPA